MEIYGVFMTCLHPFSPERIVSCLPGKAYYGGFRVVCSKEATRHNMIRMKMSCLVGGCRPASQI